MLYNDAYKQFLVDLDNQINKEIYARVTALTFDELPTERIEGRITGGSISIDGTSAIRRSCSLTIAAQDFIYNHYYWGINSKIKIEIGVKNTINTLMPEIIWFNQGIYILTTFNTSYNVNNATISINAKDKMCLLNGEVGGALESSVDFGSIEEEDEYGIWKINKIPVADIIKNMVHTYAREPLHNIIINDLENYGLELLEYRYDIPMYLYRSANDTTNSYHNMILENDDLTLYIKDGNTYTPISLKDLTSEYLDILVQLPGDNSHTPIPVYALHNGSYVGYIFTKVEYGQTAGYRVSDLIYPGDLVANIGESITSVLDKIKNMLTEFEYFYDLDGHFVFQKKQSFISTMWSSGADSNNIESMSHALAKTTSNAYIFKDNQIITAMSNNPNLANLRNDYSIWGERTGTSGAKMPIHMRYAIDKKPSYYKSFSGIIYATNEQVFNNPTIADQKNNNVLYVDWREIIYQMGLDYYKYNTLDDFELTLMANNPAFYGSGQTGYERYYIDLQGFWRQLYYPFLNEEIVEKEKEKTNITNTITSLNSSIENLKTTISDYNKKDSLTTSEKTTLNNYAIDLKNTQEELRLSEIEQDKINIKLEEYYNILSKYYYFDSPNKDIIVTYKGLISSVTALTTVSNAQEGDCYFLESNSGSDKKGDIFMYISNSWEKVNYRNEKTGWARDVYEQPDALNFWFDFLDTEGQLQQFNVKNVGSRSKAVNETSIKSIYFRETPAVVFTDILDSERKLSSYKYLQIPEEHIEKMFTISAQGKSAKNRLDELIYAHGYCIETISVTALPIYYLDVNTRIYIHNEDNEINGDYIVSKITIPLTYNGTMSINATKAAENILY